MPSGRWDRSRSASARWASQRSEITRVVAELGVRGELRDVGSVLERARVGRATFYAHFRDLPQARRAAEERGEAQLVRALHIAQENDSEPIARIAQAWVTAMNDPHVRLLLCRNATKPSRFVIGAQRELRKACGEHVDEQWIVAGAGAAEALLASKRPDPEALTRVLERTLR